MTDPTGYVPGDEIASVQFHMETLMINKLGFSQNYYTLLLLVNIVLCSKVH